MQARGPSARGYTHLLQQRFRASLTPYTVSSRCTCTHLLQPQADAGHGPAAQSNGRRPQHALPPVAVHLRHRGVGRSKDTV